MKRILTCLLVIYSLLIMACPKESAIRKAARVSFELSGITLDVVRAVDKAYAAQILSLAAKDKIAAQLKVVISGGQKFNAAITAINTEPTPGQISILNTIFSTEIVTPFLAILQEVGALSPSAADHLRVAIAALRAAILIISGTFAEVGYPSTKIEIARFTYA